jgi:hypothetical protein
MDTEIIMPKSTKELNGNELITVTCRKQKTIRNNFPLFSLKDLSFDMNSIVHSDANYLSYFN